MVNELQNAEMQLKVKYEILMEEVRASADERVRVTEQRAEERYTMHH